MTIQDLHDNINDNTEEYIDFDTFAETLIGKKAYRMEYTQKGYKLRLDQVYTIENYDNNLCGSGCCKGFRLNDGMYFWPSQLELVEHD